MNFRVLGWGATRLLAGATFLPLCACNVSSDDALAANGEPNSSEDEAEFSGPNSGLAGSRPVSEGEEVEVQPRTVTPSVFVEPGPSDIAGTAGAGGAEGGWSSALGDGDLTVLLLLDKSGSMSTNWDGHTRWQTALNSFFGGLEGVEDDVTVGAILFPQPLGCEVDGLGAASQFQFQSGRGFIDAWDAQASDLLPSGSTPLGLAFERADVAISQAEEAGIVEGRRFRVVVVTDGEPNCGTNPDRLVQLATGWRAKGVEVHVMGLPGSAAAAQLLDRIAGIGGTDAAVAPTTGNEAEDTFYVLVR